MRTTDLLAKASIPPEHQNGPAPYTPIIPAVVVRQEIKDSIRSEFNDKEYGRVTDCQIVSQDDAGHQITYAVPTGGTIERIYGKETLKPFGMECMVRKGMPIFFDGNRSKPVAEMVNAELSGESININIKYKTAEAYAAAKVAGNSQIEIRYRNVKWKLNTATNIEIIYITLTGIGLFSSGFKFKAPRVKPKDITDGPQTHIRKVRYPGNVIVDAATRAVDIEFFDSLPQQREAGDAVSLAPSCHWRGMALDQPIFPAINGEPVAGALPIGKVTSLKWATEKIYDPEFAAKNSGQPKIVGRAQLRIVFDNTPACDRELAAFVAGEARSVAFVYQVNRYTRELQGQEYVLCVYDWTPKKLYIEGGTVIMPESPSATVPAAETPRFLRRAINILTKGEV